MSRPPSSTFWQRVARAREGVTVRRPGSQLHPAADSPCGLSESLLLMSQPLSRWGRSHLFVHLTPRPEAWASYGVTKLCTH